MLARGAPRGSRPVNVASLMTALCVRVKSSAVSVWIFPALEGRESVAILPSGFPVEKEKEAAVAWDPAPSKAPRVAAKARIAVLTPVVLSKLTPACAGAVSWVEFVVLFFIYCFFCWMVEFPNDPH